MSEVTASTKGGQSFRTRALMTCVGIAVAITYASSPVSSDGRFDKFLAHIDEDDARGAGAEELT